jgi:hypothetical protein
MNRGMRSTVHVQEHVHVMHGKVVAESHSCQKGNFGVPGPFEAKDSPESAGSVLENSEHAFLLHSVVSKHLQAGKLSD